MLPDIFSQTDTVFSVAHRGASGQFPENTLPAFEAAITQKADMIELDVQWTKDGVPVVFHDRTLRRHTNGRGLLKNFSLKELKQLDAGAWFANEFTGTTIPTLKEVLQLAAGRIALNIEIKATAVTDQVQGDMIQSCMQLVTEYNMSSQVLFSSFNICVLKHLKKIYPQIPVGVLYSPKEARNRSLRQIVEDCKAESFHCSYRQLSRSLVHIMHQLNIPVLAYTVNSVKRMERAIKTGVDGIFTNEPGMLKRLIHKNNQF